LLVRNVPYVAGPGVIKYGTLVAVLNLNGDVLNAPPDHVVHFVGDQPCDKDGVEIGPIKNPSPPQDLDKGLRVDRTFSAKPAIPFTDYFEKMTSYVTILEGPAQAINAAVTARSFPPYELGEIESVFKYADTASSRAGIAAISPKLEVGRVAIVGLGGTGSYILDLIAKTPIKEIHLFDGDVFSSHNAFRSPGAPSIDELRSRPQKVIRLQNLYENMRRAIVAHDTYIEATNVSALDGMDFVFLCMDGGPEKKAVVTALQGRGVPFIDVGMGIDSVEGSLTGLVTTTTSTSPKTDHVASRISFADPDIDDEYGHNIQIAELNALNAALAVIKWKKLQGFYANARNEHFAVYTIDQNSLINEDIT